MHLLLAPAKKKMKVKIKTKSRYLDRPAGRNQGSPPANHHPSEAWGSWAPGTLPAERTLGFAEWSRGLGGGLGAFQIQGGFFETELCCLLIAVLWVFLVKENK